jgi:sporulation integral membrane protein YtvI
LLGFAAGVPDFFIFFIVFLVAVYLFTLSLPMMKISFLSLFDDKSRLQVEDVLISLRKSVFGFLRAQLLLSAITYILSFIGLLIIGTGYPLAIALLIVVVDILPILGTGSVLVPWAVYQLAIGDAYIGVGLLLLFLVITVVRRIVEPKILGDAVGISALSALISLYVGYELVGVIGVFLGPIVVIVFMAMRKSGLFDFKIKFQ